MIATSNVSYTSQIMRNLNVYMHMNIRLKVFRIIPELKILSQPQNTA